VALARRDLLIDTIVALSLAAIALATASGLGVLGFFGLPVLMVGLLWIGVERLIRRARRRRRKSLRPDPPASPGQTTARLPGPFQPR
jgi:uncharacterized membrane protein